LLTPGDHVQEHNFVSWYDVEGREIRSANYGNYNNALLSSEDIGGTISTIPDPNSGTPATSLVFATNYDMLTTTTTNPMEIQTLFEYDYLKRLEFKTENYLASVPPNPDTKDYNRVTQYVYKANGQISQIIAWTAGQNPYAQDPVEQITEYHYGSRINPSSPELASDIYSNNLVSYIDEPNGAGTFKTYFGYNAQGEIKAKKDNAGIEHTYTYDSVGNLLGDAATTIPDQPTYDFDTAIQSIWRTYDGLGRIASITSRAGTASDSTLVNSVSYTYDKFGQVYQLTQVPVSGASANLTYSYTNPSQGSAPGLRLNQVTYPNGFVVKEFYNSGKDDGLNRVSGRSRSDNTKIFENQEYVGITEVTKKMFNTQNGTYPTYWQTIDANEVGTKDPFGRPVQLKVTKNGSNINWYTHYYDNQNRLTYRVEKTRVSSPYFDERYKYNGLGMTTSFKRGQVIGNDIPQRTYKMEWLATDNALDHSGNWQKYRLGDILYTNSFEDSNEIITWAGTSVHQDANGNLTRDTLNHTFKYDAWNRLVEVKLTSSGTIIHSLSYNGLNQLVKKDDAYTSTSDKTYYYNLYGQIVEERNLAGTTSYFQYIWGTSYIDEIVAQRNCSSTYLVYYAHDLNYNVITAIDGNYGTVNNRYMYDSHGRPTQLNSSWGGTYLSNDLIAFTGRLYLYSGGIYDYRNRQYLPNYGRFFQRDPIGIWGDGVNYGNGYGYVGGDPQNLLDPEGLRPLTTKEVVIIIKMRQLAERTANEDPEFSKALGAVVDDMKNTIDQIKGKEDPISVVVGLMALDMWADTKNSFLNYDYHQGQGEWKGKNKCNKYVADVLTRANIDAKISVKKWGVFTRTRIPIAGEWADPNKLGEFNAKWEIKGSNEDGGTSGNLFNAQLIEKFIGSGNGSQKPSLGDIVSFGLPTMMGSNAHVGIYLGKGIYVSATSMYGQKGVAIKGISTKQRNLYRSPSCSSFNGGKTSGGGATGSWEKSGLGGASGSW